MTIGVSTGIPQQPERKKSGCMKWLAAGLVIFAVFTLIFSCTVSEDGGGEAPVTTTAASNAKTATSTTGADT